MNLPVFFPQLQNQTYLDHAGTTIPPTWILDKAFADLKENLYGNPHSASPSSQNTSLRIEAVRSRILRFLDAPAGEYSVIFTSGATSALKLIAESIDWSKGHVLSLFKDSNHTSALGMRQVLISLGLESQIRMVNLQNSSIDSSESLNILVYPAQCNFSGQRYPLDVAHAGKRVLDASSYLTSSTFSLKKNPVDALVFSPYKIFGYPTGIGCLVVRNDFLQHFTVKRYFGGGTVAAITSNVPWQAYRSDVSKFEDGTLPFLDIVSLNHGFDFIQQFIGWENYGKAWTELARDCREQLRRLTHYNSKPLVQFYHTNDDLGPIIAFNILKSDGSVVGYNSVATLAGINQIHLRSGCFCNAGACQNYLSLSAQDVKDNYNLHGHVCWDGKDVISGQPTGALRISFGMSSTRQDVDTWIRFLTTFFVDEVIESRSIPIHDTIVTLESILVYPIKSCGGFEVKKNWPITNYGLLHDRTWMVVDENGMAMSQKKWPKLCLIKPVIDLVSRQMTLSCPGQPPLIISLDAPEEGKLQDGIRVCGDSIPVLNINDEQVSTWFSTFLGIQCNLVYCSSPRDADKGQIAFSNESQYLLVNQDSFDDLQSHVPQDIPTSLSSFRGNIVVSGLSPWREEELIGRQICLGDQVFDVLDGCVRCQVICVNQESATKSKEPHSSLVLLRRKLGMSKTWFGVHLQHNPEKSRRPFNLSVNSTLTTL